MQEDTGAASNSQTYLSWAFSDQKEGQDDEGELEDAQTRKRRLNCELAKALAVLGVKPSTFHSLHYGGKKKKVKKLLEKHLMERTRDANERSVEEMEAEFNINFAVADLSTIHEAYQFLIKKYVEDVDQLKNENFVDMEELKKRHEKKRKSKTPKVDGDHSDVEMADNTLNDPHAGRRSRRNSFIKMTGLDVEASAQEQSLLDASKIASECLDAPSPNVKRRNSSARRKSVLNLGVDDDDDDGVSIASALSSKRGSIRRKSILANDDGDDAAPSITAALSSKRVGSHIRRKSQLLNDDDGDDGGPSIAAALGAARGERRKSAYLETEEKSAEPSPNIHRKGSHRHKSKKHKEKKPYPKKDRKGSFRRFKQESKDEAEAHE